MPIMAIPLQGLGFNRALNMEAFQAFESQKTLA